MTDNPWDRNPLTCEDCDMELLSENDVYGNKTYGEPRCEDCFVEHKYGDGE